MKYLAPFLACLILISCSHGKHKKNDLEVLHYNGKVKVITYKVYRAITDSGKVRKANIVSKLLTRCDSAGYFVEQTYFKPNDKLTYQVLRIYDAGNNLMLEKRVQQIAEYLSPGDTKPDSLSIMRDTFAYKMDDNGNKTEIKVKENGKTWYRDVNQFDANGNVLETKEYYPWDTLNKIETYKYDSKGNMVEKNWLHPDSTLIYKYSYTFDDKGNITGIKTLKADGSASTNEVIKYDDKGNKTADSCAKNDGTLIYNSRFDFTAFDDKGNWIKEIYYSNNKPETITERVVEYYK